MKMEISYTKKLDDGTEQPGTVIYNMPEAVEGKLQAWGEDVTNSKIETAVVIDIQRICRAADSPEKAQEIVSSYAPGVSRQRGKAGYSKSALMEALKGLSKEKIEELLEMAKATA